MKVVSKHSDFKGFFKSFLLGFMILIFYMDIELILKHKYEMTGATYYVVFGVLITVVFVNYIRI